MHAKMNSKKTIVEINSSTYGSTGTIMLQIAAAARKRNYIVYTFSPKNKKNKKNKIAKHYFIGNIFSRHLSRKMSIITGKLDSYNFISTLFFLIKLNRLKPDIIHVHNLHVTFLNYCLFFKYIKNKKIKIIWTLHDCYSFTGRCPHFDHIKCYKWISGCNECNYCKNCYPLVKKDRTSFNWHQKKELYGNNNSIIFVTPSVWLSNFVKKSFLKRNRCIVINNGIDLNIFKPTNSNFREIHNIVNQYMILGISMEWSKQKGIDVFIELSKRLNSKKYKIVLVGTNGKIDSMLPHDIISIHSTNNQQELAAIYSSADLFVDPTREDNYPTVIMESLACGTPVATFDTGGCSEMIDEGCGVVIEKDNLDSLEEQIIRICEKKTNINRTKCIIKSKMFDYTNKIADYINLYDELLQ